MMRRGRLRALVTLLISVCLGLFAAAQTPAVAVTSTTRVRQAVTDGPAAAPTPGSSAQQALQGADYEPAGCNTPTPKKGEVSCLAMVRTSGHRVMADDDEPPATALTPADIQAAYHLPATGQGQTVAIVDAGGYAAAEADLAVYRERYGLPACTADNGCFRKVDQRGGTDYPADDSDWAQETALDLDAVSAACAACNILLVEADTARITDLGAAVDTAVSLGAKFVSNSYGAFDTNAVIPAAVDAQFNHPGVAVVAASGDTGNKVLWPSSNPNVVAVGGTKLTAAPGSSRGWTETPWSRGGSGCSVFEPRPVYQSGLANGCEKRATADIAADADPDSGLAEYNSLAGGWLQIGGTSLASPLVAAMYALAGTPAEGTYPVTYPYVHPDTDLFDITAGSNGTCGTVLCTAGPGWDGPTGLGTPNGVAALAMGAQGTVGGQVTDRAGGAPFAGASVALTDAEHHLTFRAVTDSSGKYQVSVSAGTYQVTASVFDYGNNTISGLTVSAGRSVTANLALTKTPRQTVTGKVTDSGHGWPLYAKITIDGDPEGPAYTDPVTGSYAMSLPEHAEYAMHVTPVYPGYAPSTATVALGAGELRRDVSFEPDTTQCTAPGYAYATQADFKGWTTAPQYGWTVTDHGTTTAGWQFDNPGGRGNLTGGTGGFATADSQSNGLAEDTDLTSPKFDLVGQKSADLKFDAAAVFDGGSEADASVTTDGGKTWQRVYQAVDNVDGPVDIPLTRALGHRDVQVRFHFDGQDQSFFQLSNVSVGQCRTLGGGLTVGQVMDANTHKPINGATVKDLSAPVTDPFATGVTRSTPDDAKLRDGFYWLYSPRVGRNAVSTTAPRYTTAHATVSPSAVVHLYNPAMKAGRLKVMNAKVSLKTELGSRASKDVTLTNTGTAPLKVSVYEQNADAHATPPAAAGGSWQSLPDYPEQIMESVVASYEGRTYSVGGAAVEFGGRVGQGTLAKHNYVYDPAAGSWAQIADLPALRTAATGAFVNGTLYVVGGMDYPAGSFGGREESTTYAYHPSSDTWSRAADLPQGVSLADAAVLDGKLYVVGGRTDTGSTAASYRYDPARDTWTRIADYPVSMDAGGCGGVVGAVVCAGGKSEPNFLSTPLASTYVYHPKTDTWTRAADMPYSVVLASYSSANGELQVAGGKRLLPAGRTHEVVQYDPVGNVWTDLPDVPVAAYGAGRATGCGLAQIGGPIEDIPNGSVDVKVLPGFDQCDGDDVNWQSESRTAVNLAPGQWTRIRVTADAHVLATPGDYASTLSLVTDSPYPSSPVPVTLRATAPASWARISGTVTDTATGNPLPGARIALSHANRALITVTTDSHGRYDVWLPPTVLTITAGDDGYTSSSRVVATKPGRAAKADFVLSTT